MTVERLKSPKTLPTPVRRYLLDNGIYLREYVYEVSCNVTLQSLYFLGKTEYLSSKLFYSIHPKNDLEQSVLIETDNKFSYFRLIKNDLHEFI